MLQKTLLICAFTLSCFMGIQAAEEEKTPVSVELCDKEEGSVLASCCKGKCHTKRTKKKKQAVLACKKKDRKIRKLPSSFSEDEQVQKDMLLACKDCI